MAQLFFKHITIARILLIIILVIGGMHTLHATDELMDIRSELFGFVDFDKCGSEGEREVFEIETDEFVKNQIKAVDRQSAYLGISLGHNLDLSKSQYLLDITTPPPKPVTNLL